MENLSPMEALLHKTVEDESLEELKNMFLTLLNSKDSNQQSKTVLHKSSEQGDLAKVEFLIQLGAQVAKICLTSLTIRRIQHCIQMF